MKGGKIPDQVLGEAGLVGYRAIIVKHRADSAVTVLNGQSNLTFVRVRVFVVTI